MVKSFQWHLIVVLNPDGYEFTWLTEGECIIAGSVPPFCRLWRKNRHGKTCFIQWYSRTPLQKKLYPSKDFCRNLFFFISVSTKLWDAADLTDFSTDCCTTCMRISGFYCILPALGSPSRRRRRGRSSLPSPWPASPGLRDGPGRAGCTAWGPTSTGTSRPPGRWGRGRGTRRSAPRSTTGASPCRRQK